MGLDRRTHLIEFCLLFRNGRSFHDRLWTGQLVHGSVMDCC